ncbi:metal-dependent transcriptional regulator [Halosimplex halophilum]|uniref:metal-dependent transcriptional regulator n=1 Tax=Halosimplex halophilum TaxID=2559572 RepID=UPI00107F9957|nr:metal-dependent transcriptional regulator [Halosimplex halophilum]
MSSEPRSGPSPSVGSSLSAVERREARYLFAVSLYAEADERVTTGDLGDHLDVAAASVTEMVSKLDERGLVDYEKYRGVRLTDRGETVAARAGWRYCVVSTFFDSVLETTLDEGTAFDIGFALPDDGVHRLRALVDSACLGLCPDAGGDGEPCGA